jgi:probable F420-dependent oxidoreductase
MKFGINILNYGPRSEPKTFRQWALFAEEVGYHLLMISDHVAITPEVQEVFPVPFYDPFVTLAWLAGLTQKVALGTTVAILPYRHPLLTARLAANLDQLCHGRFILGVGIGWSQQEFEALGVPIHQRGAMSDEYLEVIRLCLTQEVVSYNGRFLSCHDVHTGPLPVQSPLPSWMGGKTKPAIRRAARYGDAWHPYRIRVDWLRDTGMPLLRQFAAAEGKPVPDLCPRIMLEVTDRPLPEDSRVAGQGTLAQIRTDLAGLADLGATHVLLDTFIGYPDERLAQPERDWEMLTLLAEQVLDLAHEKLR